MNKPLLTVVTTTYNQEKYIEETIKSIVSQQTNFKFRYIISNDNSTDNTKMIIEKYKKEYPDIIEVINRKENLGAMKNFVETLNLVDTKYLALCDGDDFWIDELKLQKQVDFLEKNDKYNICFHKTLIFFENKSKHETIYPEKACDLTLKDELKENIIPANSVVYRWQFSKKDSLKKNFPTNMVPGDHYLHLLHLKNGKKAKCLDEVMSKYRRHENGMWWLTSDVDKQILFHLKNGELLLNFYKNLIKEFNLSNKYFFNEMRYITAKTTEAYIKNNAFDKLYEFHKENKELVELCIKEITFNKEMTPFQRKLYLFMFENKIFRQKLKSKIFKK
ncbi:MAG: glycosyltransferase [Bacilli bacterium]|nr:glycosyltransferase [Bacilli bacterium]